MPVATKVSEQQKQQQQKVSRAQLEIQASLRDLGFLSRYTSQDNYTERRAKELLNAGNTSDLDAIKRTLEQLRNDFRHLAVATANATACRRRDSLEQLLETF